MESQRANFVLGAVNLRIIAPPGLGKLGVETKDILKKDPAATGHAESQHSNKRHKTDYVGCKEVTELDSETDASDAI